MNQIPVYILSMTACSALFMLLYRVLVQRKASYTFCRAYIVIAMLLSVTIPLMDVPLLPHVEPAASEPVMQAVPVTVNTPVQPASIEADATVSSEPVVIETDAPAVDMADLARKAGWILYLTGLAISLFMILYSVVSIGKLKRGSRLTPLEDYLLAENKDITSPFTFLRTVFVNPDCDGAEQRRILSHESSHVRHGHSFEKLFMSVIRSIFWFNPVMWVAEKRLEEVQEWQADNDALSEGYTVEEYRETIIRQLFGLNPATASGLNNSFTKNRLLKMKEKENKGGVSVVAASVLLASVLFVCFGCKERTENAGVQTVNEMLEQRSIRADLDGYWNHVKKYSNISFQTDRFYDDSEGVGSRTQYFNNKNAGGKTVKAVLVHENYSHGEQQDGLMPVTVVVNGVKYAETVSSAQLKWVNEKTPIIVGRRKVTYEEFKALKDDDYVGIAYVKSKTTQFSFVYVITGKDDMSAFHEEFVIESPDIPNMPDEINPGQFGLRETYFTYSCNDRYVIVPYAKFVINGNEVPYSVFCDTLNGRTHAGTMIYRNDAARQKFSELNFENGNAVVFAITID